MLEERQIRDFSQNEYTYEEFVKILKNYDKEGFELYVGTDSQINGDKIDIATCVAFLRTATDQVSQKSGDNIFYVKEKLFRKDYSALRMRMMLEAYRSLEAAMELEPLFKNKIHVHLDIGPNFRKSQTSAFKLELTGMIKSQGYECAIKPDSWCASGVADRACR